MIDSHTDALALCRSVLDQLGAPGVVRQNVRQRLGSLDMDPDSPEAVNSPKGVLMFASREVDERQRKEGLAAAPCSVGYTLPIDAAILTRRIKVTYDPAAGEYLAR